MSNAFTAPHFQSPETAREWLENLRWPEGPFARHCGMINHAYKTKKPGWYRCAEKECRKDFTVTTGTVMERSHIPLNKWLMAFYLLNASKKGMSAHQLNRALDLDYKSAWFMCHRIREAMRAGGLGPLGGEGKIVEADETYYGKLETPPYQAATMAVPTRRPRKGPPTSALSSRWSSAAATSARSMCRSPIKADRGQDRARKHRQRIAAAHRRKQPLLRRWHDGSLLTKPSNTRAGEYVRYEMATSSTPIQRKAISRSSSAE